MRNQDRYKTAKERAEAFFRQRTSAWELAEAFAWLDLEAEEEKPLPCPFCGGECIKETKCMKGYRVFCERESCGYVSSWKKTIDEAVAAHNRVAKAVKESEVAK